MASGARDDPINLTSHLEDSARRLFPSPVVRREGKASDAVCPAADLFLLQLARTEEGDAE